MEENDPYARATIRFPRPLAKRAVQGLLGRIARDLGTTVTYHLDRRYDHSPRAQRATKVSLGVRGQVLPTVEMMEMGPACGFFEGTRLNRRTEFNKIDSLRFDVTPGYSLHEHGKGTVYIWDSARNIVGEYFKRPVQ